MRGTLEKMKWKLRIGKELAASHKKEKVEEWYIILLLLEEWDMKYKDWEEEVEEESWVFGDWWEEEDRE